MLPAVNDGITSTILSNLRRNVGNVRSGEQGERKNIIRPSSDIVTTCQGMNLPRLHVNHDGISAMSGVM